ncbi:MAG TPA: C1 family peptidase [Bryobacteraceae bacterium]|jgi:C1A family cysteine protease|nr:C1 family peptidase [Bryobacteraceae bacterium]
MRTVSRYGWVPDLPDQRDHLYAAPAATLSVLPPSVDLRSQCPAVYDQGQLGSCTANAIGAAIQFNQMKQGLQSFVPSRLFIYYNERVIEHTVNSDSGAQIRDGIKSVAKQGACREEPTWPYDISKFAEKPPKAAYDEALHNKVLQYQRITHIANQMKGCLASGYPFIFGFTVYESFESEEISKTGILQMPGSSEQVVGGHAVLAVGYSDASQRFIVRNSWGPDWGQKGYFTMPYAYLTNSDLADDFWTIRQVQAD